MESENMECFLCYWSYDKAGLRKTCWDLLECQSLVCVFVAATCSVFYLTFSGVSMLNVIMTAQEIALGRISKIEDRSLAIFGFWVYVFYYYISTISWLFFDLFSFLFTSMHGFAGDGCQGLIVAFWNASQNYSFLSRCIVIFGISCSPAHKPKKILEGMRKITTMCCICFEIDKV